MTNQELIKMTGTEEQATYAMEILLKNCKEAFVRMAIQAELNEIVSLVGIDALSFRDRLTHILYHLQEKHQSIKGLFSGECGEIFLRYLKEYLCRVFDEHISVKDDIPHDYAMDIAVASFAETVRWWLKGHSDYTPEQMTENLYGCISIL